MAAFVACSARYALFKTSFTRSLAAPRRHRRRALIPAKPSPHATLPPPEAVQALAPGLHLAMSSPALSAAKLIAGPGLNVFNFVMVVRIILTWYPQTDLAKAPWIYLAVPTEPLLRATRRVVPPVGGVDISPIVWFALMSFVHEILVGPQGLLILLEQK